MVKRSTLTKDKRRQQAKANHARGKARKGALKKDAAQVTAPGSGVRTVELIVGNVIVNKGCLFLRTADTGEEVFMGLGRLQRQYGPNVSTVDRLMCSIEPHPDGKGLRVTAIHKPGQ